MKRSLALLKNNFSKAEFSIKRSLNFRDFQGVFNASRPFGPRFFKDEVCAPLKLSHSDARFARILSSALRASLKEIGFFKLKKLSNTTRKLFNLRMSLIFATFKARVFNASRPFGPRFFKNEVYAPLKLSHSDARFARLKRSGFLS